MAELMWLALLGHLVGDFLLQSKAMGLRKSEKGRAGLWLCTIHVTIYTAVIMIFWGTKDPLVALAVFAPHWVIDRWSLANKWSGLIKGRTFEAAIVSTDKYREFDVAFTSIVYKEIDATMHLLCLWAIVELMLTR
ncbi:MAG TPA: DUF3307 domain-containing protein [Verrucomicrobiae bacterium]|nr:DUF3307 domain-containing protein [Verrucomicrobiae bacterium]